uniref:Band 7 domain-containing protein n=1 Tax=Ditylenchus dipsaci TaxID=166011 RepID=A0A915EKC8_9BILA
MQLSLVETTLWLDILKLHMIDLCALSEEEVLRFFVGQRLLKNKMNCDKCGKTMRINKRAKLSDRIWWSCKQNRKQCTNKSIRSCSFFANSHLKFSQLLLLLYVWAKNYSNMQAAYETGISERHVVDWCFKKHGCRKIVWTTRSDWYWPRYCGCITQSALYNVEGGQRAVIFDRFSGVKAGVIGEGTHFLIPAIQRPIIFDIRSTPRTITTITGSKDLQNVSITLRILHRPEPSKLPNIYLNIGQDYAERVLPSITNEILKAVVAQFDAHEMITQREDVSNRVSLELAERAKQFGILLDDISITHLKWLNRTEKARYLVEKAEQMKLAAITTAEGDAQASKLLAKAFSEVGDGLIELRKIEAAEEIAELMAKNKNVTYCRKET